MQKGNLPDGRTLKIPNDLSAEKRDELANAVKAEYNIDINEGSLGEWLIDKPYDLEPDYIAPFEIKQRV